MSSQIVSVYRAASERRRVCRYIVKDPAAQMGWWENEAFRSAPCKILDLSIQGSYLEADGRATPAADQAIWLRPEGIPEHEWIKGIVVGNRRGFFGPCKLRVRFDSPLEYELFNQLVYGRGHLLETPERDLPEHERNHIWR